MIDANHHNWHMAVMWHGSGMLPRLRKMTSAERTKVILEASECSMLDPLHLCHGEQFVVPTWAADKKLTGGQVTALIVFGLWVHQGESEDMASGLVNDWPEIKMAVALAATERE